MKKLIGVIVILLTLVLSVIYRQLSHRPAKEMCGKCALRKLAHFPQSANVGPSADGPSVRLEPEQAYVPASLRDGMILSYLLLQ